MGMSKVRATVVPVVVAMMGGAADETAVMPLEPPDAARTFPVNVSPLPIDKVGWRVAIAVFKAAVVASGVKSLLMATPDRARVTAPLLVVAVMPVPPVTDVIPLLPPTLLPANCSTPAVVQVRSLTVPFESASLSWVRLSIPFKLKLRVPKVSFCRAVIPVDTPTFVGLNKVDRVLLAPVPLICRGAVAFRVETNPVRSDVKAIWLEFQDNTPPVEDCSCLEVPAESDNLSCSGDQAAKCPTVTKPSLFFKRLPLASKVRICVTPVLCVSLSAGPAQVSSPAVLLVRVFVVPPESLIFNVVQS